MTHERSELAPNVGASHRRSECNIFCGFVMFLGTSARLMACIMTAALLPVQGNYSGAKENVYRWTGRAGGVAQHKITKKSNPLCQRFVC